MPIKIPQHTFWPRRSGTRALILLFMLACLVFLLWVFTAAILIHSVFADPEDTSIRWHGDYANPAADVLVRTYMLIAETIHLPYEIWALVTVTPRWRLHPVTSLVLAVLFLPPWGFFVMSLIMIDLGCECPLAGPDDGLTIVNATLGVVVILCYLGFLGVSGRAVHLWRGETGRRKMNSDSSGGGRVRESVESEERATSIELGTVKDFEATLPPPPYSRTEA